ncbi:MAG: glycoside hydrolase family 57 protein [Candidatus Woesearchaeota archaeon]
MTRVMLYFQLHQPHRLSDYRIFDIGSGKDYFDDGMNSLIANKVSSNCYIPVSNMLLKLLEEIPTFSFAMSISGVLIEQLREYNDEAYNAISQLASHDRVELLSETYYHSLSSLFDAKEFKFQVNKHRDMIKSLFNKSPVVFRNTELLHSNSISSLAKELGFKGIIAEGCHGTIGDRSPYHVYETNDHLPLIPKASKLSDDIAFRFSNKDWAHWPLTPQKYYSWLKTISESGDTINICFDYETLGEHHPKQSGIMDFMAQVIRLVSNDNNIGFVTPTMLIENVAPIGISDAPDITSWADKERDESAWLGNELQITAANTLYSLKDNVLATNNDKIMELWRKLQTSDHYYYMSTKNMLDGSVHKYFSPYESPYDAFMRYMNVMEDFRTMLLRHNMSSNEKTDNLSLKSID